MTAPIRRTPAALALLLLVPAPSIGVLASMVLFPGTMLGKGLFAISKLWLFVFPVVWLLLVDKAPCSLSPSRNGGWRAGLLSGLAISLLILLAYFTFGHALLDRSLLTGQMQAVGLGTWPVYLAGALYWILINSVLEEYVWRWFVYTRCEALIGPNAAIALSAFLFTLHHFFALQTYFNLPLTLICSLGIWIGGAIWSYLYRRYRSIWPAYLSHAIVDLAVFGIGAYLLYGKP